MSYLGYVIAAYAVFILMLAVDVLGSRLRLRLALRSARQRQHRRAARQTGAGSNVLAELER